MSRNILFSELDITSTYILKVLGYSHVDPPDYLSELTERLVSETGSHCNPSYRYVLYDGRCEQNAICIQDTILKTGKIISSTQKKSTSFAVFVATAGTLFQAWQEELQRAGDVLSCYIVDCIGSEVAEKVADIMQEEVEVICRHHHQSITNRYSPGYCGWDLNEQHTLFSFFKGDTSGVVLKDSGLMYPIKSVSGIMGIGPDVHKKEYGCSLCRYPNCFKRKLKE